MQSPRLCARPGCQSPAAATLKFHSTRREARLVDVDDGRPSSGDLCERHACVLSLPRGWRLCDHRDLAPSVSVREPEAELLVEVELDIEPEAEPDTELTVEVEPEPEVVLTVEAEPERVLEPLMGSEPPADPDALSAMLDASTPLLRRAFRNAWPT